MLLELEFKSLRQGYNFEVETMSVIKEIVKGHRRRRMETGPADTNPEKTTLRPDNNAVHQSVDGINLLDSLTAKAIREILP